MTKVLFLLAVYLWTVIAEPPPNTYLPAMIDGVSSSYVLPVTTYSAPLPKYAPPAPKYVPPPTTYGPPATKYAAPSMTYIPPTTAYAAPAPTYGPPSGNGNGGYSAPAKYSFGYEVKAPQYYTDFGHEESRDGAKTLGSYHVLLPDGRKQMVQYVADEEGYRPKISYQDTGLAFGRTAGGYMYSAPAASTGSSGSVGGGANTNGPY